MSKPKRGATYGRRKEQRLRVPRIIGFGSVQKLPPGVQQSPQQETDNPAKHGDEQNRD